MAESSNGTLGSLLSSQPLLIWTLQGYKQSGGSNFRVFITERWFGIFLLEYFLFFRTHQEKSKILSHDGSCIEKLSY